MKTTDILSFEKESQKNLKTKLLGEQAPKFARPSKSLRPSKSMMRVKSCKPKRLAMIKGIKPLNK